jgi:hypothetical protein
MPVLISHIEVEPRIAEVSVCNNAAWAAGEIALQAGSDMEPYVTPLMERLVPVLLSTKSARSLTENSAVTIGRLALVCPAAVAPHLDVFVSAWQVSRVLFHSQTFADPKLNLSIAGAKLSPTSRITTKRIPHSGVSVQLFRRTLTESLPLSATSSMLSQGGTDHQNNSTRCSEL